MKDNDIVKSMGYGIVKGDFMRPAKSIILSVTEDFDGNFRMLFGIGKCRCLRIIRAPVVHDDNLMDIGENPFIKLRQHARNLQSTVVGRDKS